MVDTSSEYIKMCEKAEEIQQKWEPQIGDFLSILPGIKFVDTIIEFRGGDPTYIISVGDKKSMTDDYIKSRHSWLPRQDQLQEMVDLPIDTLWTEFETWVDVKAIYGAGDYRLREYKTWEQLWFAFTMDQKFRKSWNGEDWAKGG